MKKASLMSRPDLHNPLKAYENVAISDVLKLFIKMLKPEKPFYVATVIYGIAISLLTLAAPISVQMLITNVANTALVGQVIVLASVLFILLCVSGALNALQSYAMELFQRKFFARISTEIVFHNIYARSTYFKQINRTELINRYFDIMTVQKNLPTLLTSGFSLVLQSIVGLLVVSFYHPFLLAFNVIFIFSIYFVWRIWGHDAIRSALALSNAKYNVAHWLEELAQASDDFKPQAKIAYALERSEKQIAYYLDQRKLHFRFSFAQIIGYLFVYAFFSSILLGLGGWLVIIGQLTLGQLVAAELILTAIFFGISRAGDYLALLYDLLPAVEKISQFFRIPLEKETGSPFEPQGLFAIDLEEVQYLYRDEDVKFNLSIKAGEKVMIGVTTSVIQEYFIDSLIGSRTPDMGMVLVDGKDVRNLCLHSYRNQIAVLDNAVLIEGTIENFLKISNVDASSTMIKEALKMVKLDHVIKKLPNGLMTELTSVGYPLSSSESLRLKLAAALLANPKVIIMTELYDILGYHFRQEILKNLCARDDITLICITNRRDVAFFERYIFLTDGKDYSLKTVEEFRQIDANQGR